MKHKELVNSVVDKFSLKPGRARKLVDHVLCELIESGLSGEGFSSPILRVSPSKSSGMADSSQEEGQAPRPKPMRLIKSKAYVSRSASAE